MISKHELLAQALVMSSLVTPIRHFYHWLYQDLKVLAYHRILPRMPENQFPFDLELISAWEDEFDWQMGYLAKHFKVIDCRQLAEFIRTGVRPKGPCAMVTFDDGFVDNLKIAAPILQKHGIPAVVFVATDYIGSKQTYWYDQLAFEVLHTSRQSLSLGDSGETLHLGSTPEERRIAVSKLLKFIKRVPNHTRLDLCRQWHEELDAPTRLPEDTLHRPMDWDEVRTLQSMGVEIGSHTCGHPVLPQVKDDDALRHELQDSKILIERELGTSVLSLAYPTGGKGAYSEKVVDQTKKAGYQFAFTYEGGMNDRRSWNPHLIRRLAVERYTTRPWFQSMLAMPNLF